MGRATAGRRNRVEEVTRQLRILSPQPAMAGGTKPRRLGPWAASVGAAVARYLNRSEAGFRKSRTKVLILVTKVGFFPKWEWHGQRGAPKASSQFGDAAPSLLSARRRSRWLVISCRP